MPKAPTQAQRAHSASPYNKVVFFSTLKHIVIYSIIQYRSILCYISGVFIGAWESIYNYAYHNFSSFSRSLVVITDVIQYNGWCTQIFNKGDGGGLCTVLSRAIHMALTKVREHHFNLAITLICFNFGCHTSQCLPLL